MLITESTHLPVKQQKTKSDQQLVCVQGYVHQSPAEKKKGNYCQLIQFMEIGSRVYNIPIDEINS